MTLADKLTALRSRRASGELSPAAFYRELIHLLDAPEAGRADAALDPVRRIEALLEDRLGARGADLGEKADSVRSWLSPELLGRIHTIARESGVAASSGRELAEGLRRDAHAALLELAGTAAPTQATRAGSIESVRGTVRKIRYSERGTGVEQVALMDIDGRVVELRSSWDIHIEPGDQVIVAGRDKYMANLYYNESRRTGSKLPKHGFWKFTVGGGAVLAAGLTVIVVAIASAIADGHPGLGWSKYLITALVGAAVAFLGLVVVIFGAKLGQSERILNPACHTSVPTPK